MTGRGARNSPRTTKQSEYLHEKKGRVLIILKEEGETETKTLTQRNNNGRKEEEKKKSRCYLKKIIGGGRWIDG